MQHIPTLCKIVNNFKTLEQAKNFAESCPRANEAVLDFSSEFWKRISTTENLKKAIEMKWWTAVANIIEIIGYDKDDYQYTPVYDTTAVDGVTSKWLPLALAAAYTGSNVFLNKLSDTDLHKVACNHPCIAAFICDSVPHLLANLTQSDIDPPHYLLLGIAYAERHDIILERRPDLFTVVYVGNYVSYPTRYMAYFNEYNFRIDILAALAVKRVITVEHLNPDVYSYLKEYLQPVEAEYFYNPVNEHQNMLNDDLLIFFAKKGLFVERTATVLNQLQPNVAVRAMMLTKVKQYVIDNNITLDDQLLWRLSRNGTILKLMSSIAEKLSYGALITMFQLGYIGCDKIVDNDFNRNIVEMITRKVYNTVHFVSDRPGIEIYFRTRCWRINHPLSEIKYVFTKDAAIDISMFMRLHGWPEDKIKEWLG